jgi:hypothetical protein
MALGGAGERVEQRRETPGGGPLIQRQIAQSKPNLACANSGSPEFRPEFHPSQVTTESRGQGTFAG